MPRVAYAIGVPFPVMVDVKAKNSEFNDDELRKIMNKVFDFAPSNIIKEQRYQSLSAYGHFGNKSNPWKEVLEEVISKLKEISNFLNGQN